MAHLHPPPALVPPPAAPPGPPPGPVKRAVGWWRFGRFFSALFKSKSGAFRKVFVTSNMLKQSKRQKQVLFGRFFEHPLQKPKRKALFGVTWKKLISMGELKDALGMLV